MSTLFQNWHFMRIMRALLGGWAIFEAFRTSEWLLLMPGALFAMQAIFDIGCCGAAGCSTPNRYQRNQVDDNEIELSVEEVKSAKN
ncbi:MAG: hypothetical protein IT259_07425 [Saprospiraceae bacterium]|nr:hypothetical protein [Saprospiraceae bacterium]